jgi:uncharacterized HAD superfamily protein
MKRLGLDLDGVIYPWHDALYTEMQIYENITCSKYEFWTKVIGSYPKLKQEFLCSIEHLYGNQVPDKRMLPMLRRIAKDWEIYYITTRPPNVEFATQRFLEHYDFPYAENLYLSDDKTVEARAFGIDVFVEDRTKNLDALSKFCRVIGVKQFWNEDCRDRFQFVDDVYQLEGLLDNSK